MNEQLSEHMRAFFARAEGLIADGKAGRLDVNGPNPATRELRDDDQIRRAAWMMFKAPGCQAENGYSPEYKLWAALHMSIEAARLDERARFSGHIGRMLKAFLGDDFDNVMYDIAHEYEINIGRD